MNISNIFRYNEVDGWILKVLWEECVMALINTKNVKKQHTEREGGCSLGAFNMIVT